MKVRAKTHDVFIGPGEIGRLGKYLRRRSSKNAYIISDRRLERARAQVTETLKKAGWEVREFPVDSGEAFKDFRSIYPLYGELLKAGADRDSVLIAVGGGSIGDAAGFIASTYMRGIEWVGVPTTLLAQVDSSLGGKTGINHEQGKNLIGRFHQPSLVICDTEILKSLSQREIISGLGEVVKYGLAFDSKFLRFTRRNFQKAFALDAETLASLVQKSLQWKARIVARDEFDRKGIREALNFGHTFGHALEKATDFKSYQHGEGVIWGMRFAVELSKVRGTLKEASYKEARETLGSIEVPKLPSGIDFATYRAHMKHDKKFKHHIPQFVLLKKIGQTTSTKVTESNLHQAFTNLMTT